MGENLLTEEEIRALLTGYMPVSSTCDSVQIPLSAERLFPIVIQAIKKAFDTVVGETTINFRRIEKYGDGQAATCHRLTFFVRLTGAYDGEMTISFPVGCLTDLAKTISDKSSGVTKEGRLIVLLKQIAVFVSKSLSNALHTPVHATFQSVFPEGKCQRDAQYRTYTTTSGNLKIDLLIGLTS